MARIYEEMLPGKQYHFYNQAIGNEMLCKNDSEYYLFLLKLELHISPIADVIAWAVLPDEFQLTVEIKQEKVIAEEFKNIKKRDPYNYCQSEFIIERFSNWLNSYTKTINIRSGRRGSLFVDFSCRELISSEEALKSKVQKIHQLPQSRGIVNDFRHWPFTSFQSFNNRKNLSPKQKDFLTTYGSIRGFRVEHDLKNCEYHKNAMNV